MLDPAHAASVSGRRSGIGSAVSGTRGGEEPLDPAYRLQAPLLDMSTGSRSRPVLSQFALRPPLRVPVPGQANAERSSWAANNVSRKTPSALSGCTVSLRQFPVDLRSRTPCLGRRVRVVNRLPGGGLVVCRRVEAANELLAVLVSFPVLLHGGNGAGEQHRVGGSTEPWKRGTGRPQSREARAQDQLRALSRTIASASRAAWIVASNFSQRPSSTSSSRLSVESM